MNLPATSWAVLGILSFDAPLSGYDIKRWADQSLAFFYWAPSQSQIYTELRRLESLGLAGSRIEQTHAAKSRRIYEITDLGRANMAAWMQEVPADPVVLKHSHVLRLWAAHNGSLDALRAELLEYRESVLRTAQAAGDHAHGAQREPSWAYSQIALEWSERFYLDEAARIDWLIERLRGVG
ncbi:PadR family transcriptional regulator [Microbacterium sp. zg.Y1090]|uniref:PadR family transcriptional regulator n=1 Tax=Microbacterium TaxID=33882 RepID=UPI00214CDB48|nr:MULTISPECIES: PadR family transcriptional regulator [unclassified Microbacterium]MCR2813310.1 PadR family transcriptional regulator [Microbacterium sp. zg.Y1084]MCR2819856.1 PadR family transcriptional regulator [Microbacterium sp. zg.Y1090]MDL5487967.1 PadR family transcriptional regulator [Microbacterium sp. zg-Y1211]WIM28587.1 PadR family transcriptional regulator [Microbacterium sp. zg-Y1090]